VYDSRTADEATASHLMISNPIINRIAVVVLLACVYAAGYDTAKQQAAEADRQHPAAHLSLKP